MPENPIIPPRVAEELTALKQDLKQRQDYADRAAVLNGWINQCIATGSLEIKLAQQSPDWLLCCERGKSSRHCISLDATAGQSLVNVILNYLVSESQRCQYLAETPRQEPVPVNN